MPFEIVRNDITNMRVDAIVNTANPNPVVGFGVDAGIHQKAGPALLAARQRIGKIPVGGAAVTPGFELSAKYVIHAVGPVWQGGDQKEEKLLHACYEKSLKLAKKWGCESIAFPLMCAGNHGFPKPLALQTAVRAISEFLMKHEMQVYLVVFSRDAFRLSEQLFRQVSSYIDENYILEKNLQEYGLSDKCGVRELQQQMILRAQRQRFYEAQETACLPCEAPVMASAPAPKAKKTRSKESLTDFLSQTDAGFTETLLKLIDKSGRKDSEIYRRANISKQHFSKIRNDPHYQPKKATAIALALALELSYEEAADLIGRAGYAFTNSSKFDLIIRYFIEQRNYNVVEINIALYEFDQPLLGGAS
ncbi:MAG: macro domain-containing protein [Ruminococcaceae bacterium]|nr:macro domain-containing protein [Oscillospiraceae bacterium]